VAIVGRGDHRIVDCSFSDGSCDHFGGNLFVKDADSIHISGSDFRFGQADYGGGAAFEDTVRVSIENTTFEWNFGQGGGGGVYVGLADLTVCTSVRQVTNFSRVVFTQNFADIGAGFMATSIGTMPQLIVEDSRFIANEASQIGGAGAVLHNADMILQLSRNTGLNNIGGSGECDHFALYVPDLLCVAVDRDLRVPTLSTMSPTFLPTPSPTTTRSPTLSPTTSPTPSPTTTFSPTQSPTTTFSSPPVSPSEQPFHSDTTTPSLL
jgi:hypothetical protein